MRSLSCQRKVGDKNFPELLVLQIILFLNVHLHTTHPPSTVTITVRSYEITPLKISAVGN
jgi:hypothetical protein